MASAVAFVSWGLPWRAPPARWLASWLRERGDTVICAYLTNEGDAAVTPWPDLCRATSPARRLGGSRVSRALQMVAALRTTAAEWHPDIYVLFDSRSLIVATLVLPDARLIYYCLDVLRESTMRRQFERLCLRRVDLVMASEPTKLEAWGIGTHRSPAGVVVRNAPPLRVSDELRTLRTTRAELLGALGWPEDSVVYLHAGGAGADFGEDEELAALEDLPPECKLVLLGGGHPTDRASARVHVTGPVDEQWWLRWLATSDIGLAFWTPRRRFVGTDQWNTPLSWNRLYWYLAAGIPVVATGHPELRHFVLETRAGVWIDDPQPDSIATGLLRALKERKSLGNAGRDAFIRLYNYEAQIARAAHAFGVRRDVRSYPPAEAEEA